MGNTERMKGMGRAVRVNVKRKEAEIARTSDPALLRRHTGVLKKSKKLRQNILDGADFVRDVLDTYPEAGVRCTKSA